MRHIERPDAEPIDEIDQEILAGEKLILILETVTDLSHKERASLGRTFNALWRHCADVHGIDLLRPPVDIVMQ